MANVSLKIVFEIPFLTLSRADINFLGQELWWRTYTTEKTLLTTLCIELVGKKVFVAAVFETEH